MHALPGARRRGGRPDHGPTANAPWAVIRQDVAEAHLRPYGGRSVARRSQAGRDYGVRSSTRPHRNRGRAGRGQLRPSPDDSAWPRAGAAVVFAKTRAADRPRPAASGPQPLGAEPRGPGRCPGANLRLDCEEWPAGGICATIKSAYPSRISAWPSEARGRAFGGRSVMRNAEDDMLIVLKDARVMPVTMLLGLRTGARFFRRGTGPHTRCVWGPRERLRLWRRAGLAAALTENRLRRWACHGLGLGGRHMLRHARCRCHARPAEVRGRGHHHRRGRLTLSEIRRRASHSALSDSGILRMSRAPEERP